MSNDKDRLNQELNLTKSTVAALQVLQSENVLDMFSGLALEQMKNSGNFIGGRVVDAIVDKAKDVAIDCALEVGSAVVSNVADVALDCAAEVAIDCVGSAVSCVC